MAYRFEKTETGTEIVFEGWENGIAQSPHKGIANMQGVNINTETGEAMCNFNRAQQFQTGTSGTLTRVNTNTVSISGITLLVGQVITITNGGTTGLSGDYYYLSTGKLYAGALPPSTPDSAAAVTGISAGSATFSIKYPLGKPIMKATETYHRDLTDTLYYRYYFLDDTGSVWCHDTYTLVNWDTPVWFFVGSAGTGASGLAYLNGWITVSVGSTHTYWKLTSLLGAAWVDTVTALNSLNTPVHFLSNSFHSMLSGNQGKLYGTDGRYITSLFPNTSLLTGAANIQSYAKYTVSGALGPELVTNGDFTGSAAGWTLGAGWTYAANAVNKSSDGTATLRQDTIVLTEGNTYAVTYTISNRTVGDVTPVLDSIVTGTTRSANGTYTDFLIAAFSNATGRIAFTPSNTARFTIDSVSIKEVSPNAATAIISGSAPTLGDITQSGGVDNTVRIPVYFFTDGTLPAGISANTTYYIRWVSVSEFYVYGSLTSAAAVDTSVGSSGNQYFITFNPQRSGTFTWTSQRINLPFNETATTLAEIGNTVLIGGKGNVIYPWNQVSTLPQDLIYLPENNTVNIISVNNIGYIFAGAKGNIYITNGSSVSRPLSVPDYCAGIAGTPATYIEPYFSWGDAMYCRGRVYFGIQDQTATKTGNCGGIWSFTPVQNFSNAETGMALRLDNQNSYGTYNGLATLLIPGFEQSAISPQYWSGWKSSISSPTYGIDFTDTIPEETTIIETDLIRTGTAINQKTFSQVEYKLSTPLASGETVVVKYRQNGTDAFQPCGTLQVESATSLSGLFPVNFEKGQWLQLQAVLNPLANASSSFCRLVELRVR